MLHRDGRDYVCPVDLSLRSWLSLTSLVDNIGDAAASLIFPPNALSSAGDQFLRWRRDNPDAVPHIRTSTWGVPRTWFVLVVEDERELYDHEGATSVRYRARVSDARRRAERARTAVTFCDRRWGAPRRARGPRVLAGGVRRPRAWSSSTMPVSRGCCTRNYLPTNRPARSIAHSMQYAGPTSLRPVSRIGHSRSDGEQSTRSSAPTSELRPEQLICVLKQITGNFPAVFGPFGYALSRDSP